MDLAMKKCAGQGDGTFAIFPKKFPNRAILASKVDFKSAYRRCHLSAATALQTCTQLSDSNLAANDTQAHLRRRTRSI